MTLGDRFLVLRPRLKSWLLQRIAWSSQGVVALDGSPFSAEARVVVLGREHYEERRKTYSIRSWRGLLAVLKLELLSKPADRMLLSIGPLTDEGREVVFFTLRPTSVTAVKDALFCFPETLLLARIVGPGEVLHVRRAGIEYFVARGHASQIQGGAIVNSRLFALSVGLPEDAPVRNFGESELRAALSRGLRQLQLGDYWTFFVARERWSSSFPLRQMALAVGISIVTYLFLASAYLQAGIWVRERQISRLSGGEAPIIFRKQREIVSVIEKVNALNVILDQRVMSYRVWGVLSEVFAAGGIVNNVEMDGSKVIILGRSEKSISVLQAVSKSPEVQGARFDAPVRNLDGQEIFSIEVTLSTGVRE